MSLHKDSNLSKLLPMLKLLKYWMDNTEPLCSWVGDNLALGHELTQVDHEHFPLLGAPLSRYLNRNM
jgi:hypothetical protein